MEDLHQSDAASHRFYDPLQHHPFFRTAATADDDQGVAGGYQ
jgi:hypothetical protein